MLSLLVTPSLRRDPLRSLTRVQWACCATFTTAERQERCAGYPVIVASKRQIFVGDVPIGGGAPVAVQTMCKTETANLQATMDQIRTVAEAAPDLARVPVPRHKDSEAPKSIAKGLPDPLIGD